MVLLSTAMLVLVAIGILVVLAKAVAQNIKLWRDMRGGGRPLPTLLWDAFVLWSPLGLVVMALVFAATRIAASTVQLTYRLTTLDEFCVVGQQQGPLTLPCTGMGGELDKRGIARAGAQADLDHHLAATYLAARHSWLRLSASQLLEAAENRGQFYRSLSPRALLGLQTAPEDDPGLLRLRQELRRLAATPTPPARDVLDIVRFVAERDARLIRMRELGTKIRTRREGLELAAYSGRPREEQGRAWLRNRVSHLVAPLRARPDAAINAGLAGLAADPGAMKALALARRGIVTQLAEDESAVAEALQTEVGSTRGIGGLYVALGMPRLCTVASAVEDAVLNNAGLFPCAALADAPATLQLAPLGFRQSVQLSIERWHDDMVRGSFRRLGGLSRRMRAAPAEADRIAGELASVVPMGIDLGRSDCGWLHPVNCLLNAARGAAEEAYLEVHADMGRQAQEITGPPVSASAVALDERIGWRLLTLDDDLALMRRSAHVYAGRFFLGGDLLGLLGWLALALIVVKSFLYVLALELFHSDERMSIGFDAAEEAVRPVQGEYHVGRRLTIDREFPHPLITRKQLSNSDNNVCLAPWPWSAPIGRILSGRYFIFAKGRYLSDADRPDVPGQPPRGMVASAGGGQSIVEWRMRPGEEVIFRYRDFHGASENLLLSSEISLRLSTLLLGRVIFRVARCPEGEGRLLLRADVEEIDQQHIRAVPPERLIAWSRHAQFTIHSGRTLWKTLLNGYTLVRRDQDDGPRGLIVVSSDDVGSNLGSIRFVRRIFGAIF